MNEGVTIVSEWINTKDRLPEKSGRYLCFTRNEINVLGFDKNKMYSRMIWKHEVSHWMPLPEEPKGE